MLGIVGSRDAVLVGEVENILSGVEIAGDGNFRAGKIGAIDVADCQRRIDRHRRGIFGIACGLRRSPPAPARR